MKSTISNYTFNALAKTITFNDYTNIRLESILLITNVSRGIVIYQFNDPNKVGTVLNNILTLTFDTSLQSNTDRLNIVFEDLYDQQSLINKDAFGKTRVSQLTQTLDLKQINNNLPLFWDRVNSGTGIQTWIANESATTMTTNSINSYAIAQTKQRTFYRSGQSTQIIMTMYDFHSETNIVKRVGTFQSSNVAPYNTTFDGLFLENNNGLFSVQSWRTGIQTNIVNRNNWDDPLDGTGLSGVIVNWALNQKLVIDYQWLGIGRIRFGLDINGVVYYFHTIENANNNQKVYMSSSNQPIRYELRQLGVENGTLNQVCVMAATEGSITNLGTQRSITNGNNAVSYPTVRIKYATIAFRLQSTSINSIVEVISCDVISSSKNMIYRWELILNPTINGTFIYTNLPDSSIQIATGNNTNTITANTGVILFGGLGNTNNPILSREIKEAIKVGCSLTGELDVMVLALTPLTNKGAYYTTLNVTEYG